MEQPLQRENVRCCVPFHTPRLWNAKDNVWQIRVIAFPTEFPVPARTNVLVGAAWGATGV